MTPHVVVLLPAGAPTRVVEDLWSTVADEAVTAEAVVAALPLRGDDGIASFAVLVHEAGTPEGARLQVVLRGDAVIDADVAGADARRVDARQAQPFYLATLDRVRAYRVGRAEVEAGTTPGLPLQAGVVPADAVAWRRDDARSRGPAAAGVDARDAAPSARGAAPAPVDPVLVATVLDGPGDALAPSAVAGAPEAEPAAGGPRHARADADPRDAAVRAGSAGVPTAAMPTAPAPDEDTTAPRVIHAFRIVRDGVPQAATHATADAPDRIPLDVPAIVGRRPRPPRVVRGVAPRLVAVPSSLGEISGTHLGLRQDAGVVVVTDLDSTNGTVVLAPGADRLALRPGESLVVVPGTRIDIGDGVVLEILSAR
ncbi:FHA domain-containing protein [Clavibacter michiganensis]|uniref:FHA domain-containing protein n=1 Tax=Clavibacter michiganensis TaxID=28447 RepID=UPI001DAC7BBF|nr:FHA domain-containing protein [Clavibacter michiganensis]MBP2457862.1 hypothetical protein [Clavibacter michiganensis]MDQ0410432.1 hypothetical protein [Clavibacter michiganensis]